MSGQSEPIALPKYAYKRKPYGSSVRISSEFPGKTINENIKKCEITGDLVDFGSFFSVPISSHLFIDLSKCCNSPFM
jgi:hypothetical protein